MMECERRMLFQAWKHEAIVESLPEYHELWRRDRRLSLAVVEAIGKLSDIDRCILISLLRLQPCKKEPLCHSVSGPKPSFPGNFNGSLERLQKLDFVRSGKGRSSRGYSLTDMGMQVADALRQMSPPSNVRAPS